MPKLVFLATDIVLYLLVVALAFYVWHARRTPTLRQTWRTALHSPSAMSAAVVLLLFLGIALADSFHFRPLLPPAEGAAADAPPAYATQTLSLLDVALSGPRAAREKTYSVPLGTHQFTKESMLVGGTMVRDFPRCNLAVRIWPTRRPIGCLTCSRARCWVWPPVRWAQQCSGWRSLRCAPARRAAAGVHLYPRSSPATPTFHGGRCC
jgi:hypothetical protein